jgi:hypothetical protein
MLYYGHILVIHLILSSATASFQFANLSAATYERGLR